MPLQNSKVRQQPKLNQISPDLRQNAAKMGSAGTTALVSATNSRSSLSVRNALPAAGKDVASASQNTLLDTASELHLGLGPFNACDSILSSGEEGLPVGQLASCGSIIPGQIMEESAW